MARGKRLTPKPEPKPGWFTILTPEGPTDVRLAEAIEWAKVHNPSGVTELEKLRDEELRRHDRDEAPE